VNIYLAAINDRDCIKDLLFQSPYLMESYYYIRGGSWVLDDWLAGKFTGDLMFDSGAFTFMHNSRVTDWDPYNEAYAELMRDLGIKHFIELDVEGMVGMEKVEKMRARLEHIVGRQCMPVWHPARGLDYWRMMVREYDYVCLGGIAGVKQSKQPIEWTRAFPWFLRTAQENNCKVHILGYGKMEQLQKHTFHSTDQSSWKGARWGTVYRFDGRKMVHARAKKGQRSVYWQDVERHNLAEWMKFQAYAAANL